MRALIGHIPTMPYLYHTILEKGSFIVHPSIIVPNLTGGAITSWQYTNITNYMLRHHINTGTK